MSHQGKVVTRITLSKVGASLLSFIVTEIVISALCGLYYLALLLLLFTAVLVTHAFIVCKNVSVNITDFEIPRAILLGDRYQCYIELELSKIPQGFKYEKAEVSCSREIEISITRYSKSNSTVNIKFQIRGLHVGVYRIESITLLFSHFTRLLLLRYTVYIKHEVRVEAKSIVLIRTILAGRGTIAGLGEAEVPRPSRAGLEYFGSRPYVPGDDYRFIDWRATARTGKLHVKEFYSSGTGSVQIILNTMTATEPAEVDMLVLTFLSLVHSLLRIGNRVLVYLLFREQRISIELRRLGDLGMLAEKILKPLAHEIETCNRVTAIEHATLASLNEVLRGRIPLLYITTHKEDLTTLLYTAKSKVALIVIPATAKASHLSYARHLGLEVICDEIPAVVSKALDKLTMLLL